MHRLAPVQEGGPPPHCQAHRRHDDDHAGRHGGQRELRHVDARHRRRGVRGAHRRRRLPRDEGGQDAARVDAAAARRQLAHARRGRALAPRRHVCRQARARVVLRGPRWRLRRGGPLHLPRELRHHARLARAARHRRVCRVAPRHPEAARCQRRAGRHRHRRQAARQPQRRADRRDQGRASLVRARLHLGQHPEQPGRRHNRACHLQGEDDPVRHRGRHHRAAHRRHYQTPPAGGGPVDATAGAWQGHALLPWALTLLLRRVAKARGEAALCCSEVELTPCAIRAHTPRRGVVSPLSDRTCARGT
mmetsp:Transcript_16557/g.35516  ORF Transcript_16557/g.35516 Transcript_16557/m.35516 type:complete len:305 (+) Transcript_16557:945-1859(+)